MTIGFGQKLRKLREMRSMSREQLAAQLGQKGTGYLFDIERGAFIPSEEKLKRIAAALDFPYPFVQGLLLESRLESLGIDEPVMVAMFKDYPNLTKKDKQAIMRTYKEIKAARKPG